MKALSQYNLLVWFTGLLGARKTTLAMELKKQLDLAGSSVYILDGDLLRVGLNSDLRFSASDRSENLKRAADLVQLLTQEGYFVLAIFISNFLADRVRAKETIGPESFRKVFVEMRDVKWLYVKARAGLITNFTGINSPFEHSNQTDLIISSDKLSVNESVIHLLKSLFYTER